MPQPGNWPPIDVEVVARCFKKSYQSLTVPAIRQVIPRGNLVGWSHVHIVSKSGSCKYSRDLNLGLFLIYKPTPSWGPVVRFLAVRWYPEMWRWFSMIESPSQVSVNKAIFYIRNHTFRFVIGASEMGLAKSRLTPYLMSFLWSWVPGLRWQCSSFFVYVCWSLAGDSWVKPLGWNGCLCCRR